ncbi:hypothetical protein OQA88_10679 [Cercophora sp. LCS_1]
MPLTTEAPYTVIGVLDSSDPFFKGRDTHLVMTTEVPSAFPNTGTWMSNGIVPCGRATGVAQFLCVVLSVLKFWESGWYDVLDSIDQTVSFDLQDTLDEDKWSSLMFDDSFQRSKVYSTVLETLRVSGDWVRDFLKTWESLREQWETNVKPDRIFDKKDSAAIEKNWAVVDRMMRARAEVLLTRITSKAEEVKSLRDGVFNATSLREASKGIELNRAVYVFTVVTVIFTPPGFLAVSSPVPMPFLAPNTFG